MDWSLHNQYKDWVRLEGSLSPFPLGYTPWLAPTHIPPTLREHPLIGPILGCFREACQKLHISSTPGPLTPIRLNLAFLPGMSAQFLTNQWQLANILAHQFFCDGSFLDRLTLTPTTTSNPLPFWTYFQIHHFLQGINRDSSISRPFTPFEHLFSQSNPQQHLISSIYAMLFTETTPKKGKHAKHGKENYNQNYQKTNGNICLRSPIKAL